MGFIDWFPVGSTIKHLTDNPKGMRVSDYTCNMDTTACTSNPAAIAAAKAACERDIDLQLIKNIEAYIGSIPNAIVHDVVGDIVTVIIAYLIKRNVARAAGLSIPVVGVVLGVDSIIDISIVISTLNRMKRAAARAKIVCCKCSEAACSNAKMNTSPLEITRWYWGAKRSLKQTTSEAQDYADNAYTCNGTCSSGTCKPKIYVLDSTHRGLYYVRTWLRYDVYCECF
jgi:hypothetical protein